MAVSGYFRSTSMTMRSALYAVSVLLVATSQAAVLGVPTAASDGNEMFRLQRRAHGDGPPSRSSSYGTSRSASQSSGRSAYQTPQSSFRHSRAQEEREREVQACRDRYVETPKKGMEGRARTHKRPLQTQDIDRHVDEHARKYEDHFKKSFPGPSVNDKAPGANFDSVQQRSRQLIYGIERLTSEKHKDSLYPGKKEDIKSRQQTNMIQFSSHTKKDWRESLREDSPPAVKLQDVKNDLGHHMAYDYFRPQGGVDPRDYERLFREEQRRKWGSHPY